MTDRGQRTGFEVAAALVAAALAWAAACSWRGLVSEPSEYLVPAAVAAVLVAAVGATARSLRLRWYATLGIQLVVLLVWFHHRQNPGGALGGWLPTPGGVAEVIDEVGDGSYAVNTYAAPVPGSYVEAPVYLLVCALAILLLVDLLACGLRLPAWAGLPVLVAVTIPISVLDGGLPGSVYVATGILFAVLLAVVEAGQATAWGPAIRDVRGDTRSGRVPAAALGAPALLIATAATSLALLVSLGVPVGDGLLDRDSGSGSGKDGEGRVTLTNPLVDLRRDLVRNDHVPLLDVRTEARDVSYLRLTILDTFTGDSWSPSVRDLGAENRADGQLPSPPGLRPARTGPETGWLMRTTDEFATSWLPTPSITRAIQVFDGDWRYDPTFLDIASADDPPPTEVDYELSAAGSTVTAEELAGAPAAPPGLNAAMTALPNLPPTVAALARQITAPGRTIHAKVALLQDWFRNSGGFRYSLEPAPGEGMGQLVRFLTTDKVGYCEQFAASMALMARSLGIPARVVVGFLNPSEGRAGSYRFTSDDLHAWPEVYFAGAGWVRFEPTPSARTGDTPSWTRSETSRPSPSASPSAPTAAPSQQASQQPEAAPQTPQARAEETDQGAPVLALVVGGLALLVLAIAAPGLVRSEQRRRRLRTEAGHRAAVEGIWAELRATAIDLGAPWPEGRSPRMVGEALTGWVATAGLRPVEEADRAALAVLVSLVERARYRSSLELDDATRARAQEAGRHWGEVLAGSVRPVRARVARLAPRSILARRQSGPVDADEQTDELAPASRP